MESVFALASVAATGLILMLVTLRPRSPQWPPLHLHSNLPLNDRNYSEENHPVTLPNKHSPGGLAKSSPSNGTRAYNSSAQNCHQEEAIKLLSTSAVQNPVAQTANGVVGQPLGEVLLVASVEPTDGNSKSKEPERCESVHTRKEDDISAVISEYLLEKAEAERDDAELKAHRVKLQEELATTRPRRVLFVIAHPDDECMFFGPSILHFVRKQNAMVFLVCFTYGSYRGTELGQVRKRELWDSCKILGIPAEHITLYKCEHMPDHPTKTWPVVSTANIINRHLHSIQCDMVVTFDGGGVSGHINHRSLHASLSHLVEERLLPVGCLAYQLDSVNLLRKYSSVLDLACSVLCSKYVIMADSSHFNITRAAMKAHASQYVWFRKLYMVFSRYVVINTLTLMTPVSKAPCAW